MKSKTIGGIAVVVAVLAFVSYWIGQWSYHWLPPQASAESILVDNLFSLLTAIGSFIFLGVTGTLIYSALFQQVGKYDMDDGPPIEGNVMLEVVWTAIPFVLVLWIGAYSFQAYDQMGILGGGHGVHGDHELSAAMASRPSDGSSISEDSLIDVFARQWAWEFRYPNGVTSTELHLPRDQRARLQLHSEDVIHGFYVPAFRVKQDIVPNEVTLFEFTPIRSGRYRLRDSLYSGTYFAAMQADVVVESPENYQQWLAMAKTQSPTMALNPAYREYRRKLEQEKPSGWPSVPPASPPVVNVPGELP